MISLTESERLLESAARSLASPAFRADRLIEDADKAKAEAIRCSLQKIEREASRGPIDRRKRAFYHNLLAVLGEYESKIEERRKLDERP